MTEARSEANDRVQRVAALANEMIYDSEATRRYVQGAPHLKHASLRALYATLAMRAYESVGYNGCPVEVLDLGAGEGSATRIFLELGARVTAVDVSSSQLEALQQTCAGYAGLTVRQAEAMQVLRDLRAEGKRFGLIVALSFLHHIPDYLALIREAHVLLQDRGLFFSFQDPLRYDTLDSFTRSFGFMAYYSWRTLQGDLVAGAQRRLRRSRGIYHEESPEDNAEYHVIRGGVDQDAIAALFAGLGCRCEIVRYFSTQSGLWQTLGARMGLKNTFAVLAEVDSVP